MRESIFGALFTLWTAPIDGPKLDISQARKPIKTSCGWPALPAGGLVGNLIVGQKP